MSPTGRPRPLRRLRGAQGSAVDGQLRQPGPPGWRCAPRRVAGRRCSPPRSPWWWPGRRRDHLPGPAKRPPGWIARRLAAGTPPARSGAAMAYDSTAGVTVMFGGIGGSGRPADRRLDLGRLGVEGGRAGARPAGRGRLVDDPADGGVLLLGTPVAVRAAAASVSSGCSGGGTGRPRDHHHPGARRTLRRRAAPAVPAEADRRSGADRRRPVARRRRRGSPGGQPARPARWRRPACRRGCSTARGGTTPPRGRRPPPRPPAHSSLSTHEPPGGGGVAARHSRCGPPLETPVRSGAAIACPASATASSGAAIAPAPCGTAQRVHQPVHDLELDVVRWARGGRRRRPASRRGADPALQRPRDAARRPDGPVRHRLARWHRLPGDCLPADAASCLTAAVPMVTTWIWSGTGWVRISQVRAPQQGPDLFGGAAVAAVERPDRGAHRRRGHVDVRGGAVDAGLAPRHPSRAPARPWPRDRMAPSCCSAGCQRGFLVVSSANSVGSDTWTWSGRSWRHSGAARRCRRHRRRLLGAERRTSSRRACKCCRAGDGRAGDRAGVDPDAVP